MADTLQFSRNTRVFLKQGSTYWEIPVLDGFSFSQATNATEVTLNEMSSSAGLSRRARQMFTDSYAPAEWSFSTYMRPVVATPAADNGWEDTGSDAIHHSVEEPLWANFVAANSFTASDGEEESAWTSGVTGTTSGTTYDFSGSNTTTLGTYDLFFVLGGCGVDESSTAFAAASGQAIYKIADAVGNTASIDFDIDGIAMINWSGFGKIISDEASLDLRSDTLATNTETLIKEGGEASDTGNFIRNRLTSLAVAGAGTGNFASSYSLVLTGGNITFENNITYLTPETLCTVNQPIGHVTGTRSVSGNFTCYLNSPASGSSSVDLFEDIIESTTVVTNSFGLTFTIGGTSAPKVVIALPASHLEVPTHSIDDVISVETNFHALPSSLDGTDEATIQYVGG